MERQLCIMCSKLLRGENLSCATLQKTYARIHVFPNFTMIQNNRSINPISHTTPNIILQHKCVLIVNYTNKILRVSTSDK